MVVVISATTNLPRYWYASLRLSSKTGRRPAGAGKFAHQISNCLTA
jgi:hypothetical protein